MCNSRSSTEIGVGNQANKFAKVDRCMANLIRLLNVLKVKTLACCCGHGKYDMSIVILARDDKTRRELISGKIIPRERRFYKKNQKTGYYYIPEVVERC